ncbi:cycloartenol synthase-like [Prosopis cineraria]|uniref:cycloartenol synthase-like n=1 Tax=Prosopis cineraria TaxID=364024 RepID=UPI0024103846|nr:cycloartenol synthase-like [Prosopis cineraria]
MWRQRIGERGNDPYIFSTNNFVGRQTWEFHDEDGSKEERDEVEAARQRFSSNRSRFKACADVLWRFQGCSSANGNACRPKAVGDVSLTGRLMTLSLIIFIYILHFYLIKASRPLAKSPIYVRVYHFFTFGPSYTFWVNCQLLWGSPPPLSLPNFVGDEVVVTASMDSGRRDDDAVEDGER